jgi:hypothetical protein
MPEKQKYSITPEEIEARRKRALELHKRRDPVTNRPLFGGAQPGSGRPKKRRATEVINEEIERNALEYFQRLDKIAKGNVDGLALAAIRQLMEIANKETDVQAKEDRQTIKQTTEELRAQVASRLARLAESGKLPLAVVNEAEQAIADAEVIEARPELDSGESTG